jgi:hypothetical protein
VSTARTHIDTPWGPWEPFTPDEVAGVLEGTTVAWWIAGGWALEALVGRSWRQHDDVDVGFFRDEQVAIRDHLEGWDVRCSDPPGQLRPWLEGEKLPAHVHAIWVRETATQPWRLQLMIDERRDGVWRFRRDARIQRPVDTLTWQRDGRRYIAPEVQLLYKAKGMRAKDQSDFDHALPLLKEGPRMWLRDALSVVHPGHPWIARVAT